jgi:hypothetical protein
MLPGLREEVCAEYVKNTSISFSHTPSPCTHTHIDTLHAHAHPVSHKVPLAGEGKVSREGEGSWRGSDGVESTPRDVLEQPFYPPFSPLSLALCTSAGSCPPKSPRNRAATHRRHTSSAAASNRLTNTSATAAVRGGARGGTLFQMRGVCKRGGASRLDVRTCAPRGHPVVSIAAAQPSALAGGRRASAAKRENLLCRG